MEKSTPFKIGQDREPLKISVGYWVSLVIIVDLSKKYGKIAQPLTKFLQKDSEFKWDAGTKTTFDKLKLALISALVLTLPDFNAVFTIETDALGSGIGVVLLQKDHPLANRCHGSEISITLSLLKEFYALLLVVKKWQHYFLRQHFIIKTDQKVLKHLLDQPSTLIQNWGLEKLTGLDFSIEYKKGKDNTVADVLSNNHMQGVRM